MAGGRWIRVPRPKRSCLARRAFFCDETGASATGLMRGYGFPTHAICFCATKEMLKTLYCARRLPHLPFRGLVVALQLLDKHTLGIHGRQSRIATRPC